MTPRDHGGGIDAAAARWGGVRADWLDLSTGINPRPYPLPELGTALWRALPDRADADTLERAARQAWHVPQGAAVLAAPGASALIARIPALGPTANVHIPTPTYNEHAAAFLTQGWDVSTEASAERFAAQVLVNPNNPDGRWWARTDLRDAALTTLDESFADVDPARSLITIAARPGTIVLKSFGKFWGLAGLRLGFAIGDPALIGRLAEMLGPWPVSGPALAIGSAALADTEWAHATRLRLKTDAARLDGMMARVGTRAVGGTSLFRLYQTKDAGSWQDRLAQHRIWSRVFPYDPTWLRLGLPGSESDWTRLATALDVPG
ncbi:MAG: threonine-phosphate decarboxylase CobD [Rhodobacteraceae bacterium]|nr:threonine-phosphate decarboxylase CobD [Paracoccaceae bacterium]